MSETRVNDYRGVSTVVGYTITLAVTTLLISGLLIGTGGFVETQRDRAVRSELGVIGQQIAADAQTADRIVQRGNEDFTIERDLPDRVTGRGYTVEIVVDNPQDTYIELRVQNPDVVVQVDMTLQNDIDDTSFSGGELVVTYDTVNGEIKVDNDA